MNITKCKGCYLAILDIKRDSRQRLLVYGGKFYVKFFFSDMVGCLPFFSGGGLVCQAELKYIARGSVLGIRAGNLSFNWWERGECA